MIITDNKNGTWNLTVNNEEFDAIATAADELKDGCVPERFYKVFEQLSNDIDAWEEPKGEHDENRIA